MAQKFHINNHGEATPCRAEHKCPFGDAEHHYSTQEQARQAFEQQMATPEGPVASFRKRRRGEFTHRDRQQWADNHQQLTHRLASEFGTEEVEQALRQRGNTRRVTLGQMDQQFGPSVVG